jgi:hypothetical protein
VLHPISAVLKYRISNLTFPAESSYKFLTPNPLVSLLDPCKGPLDTTKQSK